MDLYNKLDSYVKEHVNEHRYAHTLGVVEAAVHYAERFGADVEKARIAAIFHDACKSNGPLEHGPAAALLIQKKFGVYDEDIINAIKYHTVGRANMSILERVVKCADLTDKTRDYPTVEYFRKRLNEDDDINPVFLEMMLECKEIVEERGQQFSKTSMECIEWLKKEISRSTMDNKELALKVAGIADDKKAQHILIIDIAEKSGFADYFILATASSYRQIDALADEIEDKLAEDGLLVKHIEGQGESGWVLMDYGDIIVNLFSEEQRSRYSIEKVWGDCDRVEFTPSQN
ncbi:MAG: ribosome silencing factor [Clostridia bacterium]|nr:ribosome silencing factor [Clostridia bacterium]